MKRRKLVYVIVEDDPKEEKKPGKESEGREGKKSEGREGKKPEGREEKKKPEGEIFIYIREGASEYGRLGKEKIDSIISSEISPEIEKGPLDIFPVEKNPSIENFQKCLDVYENNQDYYNSNITELIKLEKWFASINEPNNGDLDWSTREKNRKMFKISDYCDPMIRKELLKRFRS